MLLALLLLAAGHAHALRVYHRLIVPDSPDLPPFSLRAAVDTADQSPPVLFSITDGALYQVALQNGNEWLVSSVKACHLQSASRDLIVVHLSSSQEPYHLDYFLDPIPPDGSCPGSVALSKARPPSNTTIEFRHPTLPPLPELRMPPPMTPQGQIVQPEPEQSFLQKYWMYLVGALLVMMFAPAPGEDGPGQPAAKN